MADQRRGDRRLWTRNTDDFFKSMVAAVVRTLGAPPVSEDVLRAFHFHDTGDGPA